MIKPFESSSMRNILIFAIVMLIIAVTPALAQKPIINAVDKTSAGMEELITINGANFGTDKTKLKVSFGAVAGTIKNATNQLIEVYAPAGTTFETVSVTNTQLGLTSYAAMPLLLSFHGDAGVATSDFSAETPFNAESGLYDLCLCDFNNDFKTDIATASTNSNSLAIFQNNGAPGTISFAKTNILLNARTLHITCGDLNGDGKSDLVVTENDGARIFIFRSTSGMSFSISSITLTGRKVKRPAIADLDLDGKPEVIVSDQSSNVITILPNQSSLGSISFSTPISLTVTGASSTDALQVKDLDGDGLPEITTSQFNTITDIFILENNSTPGNFNFTDITTLPAASNIVSLKVGDIDGDGKQDIVATRLLGQDVITFRNQSTTGSLTFATLNAFSVSKFPWGLDFGDVDGDGKADVVISSIESSAKTLTILNSTSSSGSISFAPMVSLTTTFINRHVRIGDMDNDGKPDLVFASVDDNNLGVTASKISVFRNQSCFTPEILPAGPLNVCTGFDLELNSSAGGGVTYDWKKDNGSVKTGAETFLDVTTSGSYTVTATSEAGACVTNSNAVSVTVSPSGIGLTGTPNATSNGPICTSNTLNLSVNDVGASEYNWTGPSGFTASGRTPSRTDFAIGHAGLYILEMKSGGCVAAIDSVAVEAVSNPDFSVSFSGGPVVCAGSSKVLSVSPVLTSGFSYQWFEEAGGSLAGQTNPTLSVTSSGNYFVKVTSSFAGCSPDETDKVAVKVLTIPVAAFVPSVTSACVGQVVNFTNNSTADPLGTPTYAWTFGEGSPSTDQNPTKTYATTGSFQVKLVVSYNGDCPDEETTSVTIGNAPAISVTAPENKFQICVGGTLQLGVTGDTFSNIAWNNGETTPTILVDEAGAYSVTVTTSNNCIITKNQEVAALAVPNVIVSATPDVVVVGKTSQLSATGLESYLWRPGLSLSDSTIANPLATPLTTITYTVSGLDVNGCEGEGSVEVLVTGTSALDLLKPKPYFSPNGDSYNQLFVIDNIDSFPGCALEIYTDKGAKVYSAKPYTNTWDGNYKGTALPAGVYYYSIKCDGESKVKTGSITLLK